MKVAICGYPPFALQVQAGLQNSNIEFKFFISDFISAREEKNFAVNLPPINFFEFRRLIDAGELDGVIIVEDEKKFFVKNAVQIFNEISCCRNITTFFLGGRFDPEIQGTFGDDTNEQLSRYKADKLIMGMDGADIDAGATTYNYLEATAMRLMMKCAREKILVVDDSKIGRAALVRIGMLSEFDVIVTNYQPGLESYYNELRTMGVNVVAVRAN